MLAQGRRASLNYSSQNEAEIAKNKEELVAFESATLECGGSTPLWMMVERAELLIAPWRWLEPDEIPGWDRTGWGRPVSEPATGTPLGFVRATKVRPWRWLTAQRLDVLETEDASLLMSLRHPWLGCGRWHVIDAENRRLGVVQLPHVLDGDRGRLGIVEVERGIGRFRRMSGEVCATFDSNGGGLTIRHAVDSDPNPFLRMVILGAALALDPMPE